MKRPIFSLLLPVVLLAGLAQAQEKTAMEKAAMDSAPQLAVTGLSGKVFSLDERKQMPRETVTVTDPHTKATQKFEGVLLSSLLAQIGAPSGRQLHGMAVRDYVEVLAMDNYKAIFALAELDSSFQDNKVIVADTLDGKPLDAKRGPLQLVVPQDHRAERWVRMLTSIRVRQLE